MRDPQDIEILDFIRSNQDRDGGVTKRNVIEDMTRRSICAAQTTYNRIQDLIGQKTIREVRIHKKKCNLYINEENEAEKIFQEIRDFQREYFVLLQRVVGVFENEYRSVYDEFPNGAKTKKEKQEFR